MLVKWRALTRTDKAFLTLLCVFFAILGVTGGASRADEPLQLVVVVTAAVLILVAGAGLSLTDWRSLGPAIWFPLCAMGLVLMQLFPLPPSLWVGLPGRHVFAEAIKGAGVPLGWHPISLTPDLTASSLLTFVPILALLALYLRLSGPARSLVPSLVLGLIATGALLAMAQVATGAPYFYRVANFGEPTGSFANRNHFALFTALSLPLLAVWSAAPSRDDRAMRIRPALAGVMALTVVALILVAGSRGGLLVSVVGGILGLLIWAGRSGGLLRRGPLIGAAVALAGAVALAAVFSAQSRNVAFARLMVSSEDDIRGDINRTILPMIADHMPFGSGFGSFVSVYKLYEPLATLGPKYANQAHNDILQSVLEGGVPASLLLIAFTAWFVSRSRDVWKGLKSGSQFRRDGSPRNQLPHQGRAASVMIVMIGIMSMFDYPLRTPLVATVFILAVLWLEAGARARNS